MADTLTTQSATPATIPASTVIATDDAGAGGHVQIVKLAISTDGSATALTANNTDGLLVNLGSNNDVTVTGTIAATQSGTWDEVGINDSGNSITVDAPVGTPVFVRLSDGSSSITTLPVSAASLPLPSGASSLAEQQSQTTHLATIAGDTTDIETAVELIDDTVATLGTTTYSEATTKGLIVGAVRRDADTTLADTTNEIAPLQVDANGRLKVEAFSGETLPVSLTSTTVTGTVAVTQSGTWDEIGINDSGNSITVDNGGTFAVQVDGTALTRLTDIETNTDSGAVVGNGAAATAQRVTLANDSTGIVALTTSTASIGKLAANSGVDIGDVDVTSLPALVAGTAAIGKLLPPDRDVTAHTLYAKKYYTSTGAATDGIIWSPAAGTRWHVVSMYINVSAATTLTLEDDKAGGDEAIWKGEYAANSGVTIHFGEMYPLASGEDAADLMVTTTAGNVYITVTGYEV